MNEIGEMKEWEDQSHLAMVVHREQRLTKGDKDTYEKRNSDKKWTLAKGERGRLLGFNLAPVDNTETMPLVGNVSYTMELVSNSSATERGKIRPTCFGRVIFGFFMRPSGEIKLESGSSPKSSGKRERSLNVSEVRAAANLAICVSTGGGAGYIRRRQNK